MFRAITVATLVSLISSVASAQTVGNRAPSVDTSGQGDFITSSSPLPDGGRITSTVYGNGAGPNYFVEDQMGFSQYGNAYGSAYGPAYSQGYAGPAYGNQGYWQPPYQQQFYQQPQYPQQAYQQPGINPYARYATAPNGYQNYGYGGYAANQWQTPQFGSQQQFQQPNFQQPNQQQFNSQQRPPQERFAQANWPTGSQTQSNFSQNHQNQNTQQNNQSQFNQQNTNTNNRANNELNYAFQPRTQVAQVNYQQPAVPNNQLQWNPAAQPGYNPACCGQPNYGFYQQPIASYGQRQPVNPNPFGAYGPGYGAGYGPNVQTGQRPVSGYNTGYGQNNPYGYSQPWRPLIPLRTLPPGVYVGQGLIGQPVAYVNGEPVRNFLRYISP